LALASPRLAQQRLHVGYQNLEHTCAKPALHLQVHYYKEYLHQQLPDLPEYHVVARAGHYDFLPPRSERLAAANPLVCADASGFDRPTFHRGLNQDIVRFFQTVLGVRREHLR
jgi:predicted dienelactone hydrolase